MLTKEISENIHLLAFNDRRTQLFENLWPLPEGVSYNSYLITGSKNILIDTAERRFGDDFFNAIDRILQGGNLDYLLINHVEPDHSGLLAQLLIKYPSLEIYCSKMHRDLLNQFYEIKATFNIIEDGANVKLGDNDFTFYSTQFVHWPDSQVTYENNCKILFSNDSFGSFGTLNGGVFDDEIELEERMPEAIRYWTNIVGKYGKQTQKALQKLCGLEIKMLAPSHGILWRSHVAKIMNTYYTLSSYEGEKAITIVFGSLYGNNENAADAAAQGAAEAGIKKVRVFDSSKVHPSYIMNEIIKNKGVILVSSVYNGGIFPSMSNILGSIAECKVPNKKAAVIGGYSWGAAPLKKLDATIEEAGWEKIGETVKFAGAPKEADLKAAYELGKLLAESL
ncbi:MAG: FprA family A-type flavoprotein [bacterium]